jgi:hypothetical protein
LQGFCGNSRRTPFSSPEPHLDAFTKADTYFTAAKSPDAMTACDHLRDQAIAEMTATLAQSGDSHQAPDGVLYSLTFESHARRPSARAPPLMAELSEPGRSRVDRCRADQSGGARAPRSSTSTRA